MDSGFERAPVGIVTVDGCGEVTAVNDRARDLLAVPANPDEPFPAVFPESVDGTVRQTVKRCLEKREDGESDGSATTGREVEEYYPTLERWLAVTVLATDDGATVYLRDCSDRYEDRQTVTSLRSELDRLSNINSLISEVLAELVAASSREEIAETICRRTGETDLYEFAWVGERELGGEDIVPKADAGTTGRTLDSIVACLGGEATTPEQQAVETATPQVVHSLGEADTVPEALRRSAFADGIQSVLAVPLVHGDSVYGVVGIYAADRAAFSERERENFATVGEMAGFAINAARHRNLLLSDTVVELDLTLTDDGDPLVDAAASQAATLDIEGLVPQADGELLCYLSVTDAEPEAVAGALARHSSVGLCRVIGTGDDAGTLEVALGESAALGRLAARGTAIAAASFTDGTGEVTVECSPDEDVRRIADALTREYDAGVVAKRERQRDITTQREFRETLSESLTEKQENALRAAFFADYFESPRGSSAAEVAEALDITGPTLLYHLRAGQRKVLAEFFETTADT